MPNPPIAFPANFTPASALAFANPDNSAQVVSAASPLPVSVSGLSGFSISNFPAMQPVSGAVSVANFPAMQPVSGAVSVANFPATQAVSGSVSVANLPATQSVSGSVSVANFPATQAITAAALPLPSGAATAGNQATGNTALASISGQLPASLGAKAGAGSMSFAPATDLANLEPAGSAITGTAMPAGGLGLTGWLSAVYKSCTAATPAGTAHIGSVSVDDVPDALVTSGSATSATVVVSTSTAGFAGGSFQVTATGTSSTITFEQSNDNVNWITLPITGVGTASSTSSPGAITNALGIYGFASSAAYVRARVSTYVSGTVTVVLAQKRAVAPFTGISLAGSSSTIGAVTGSLNTATGYTDSTTALGAAATFTGTGRAFNSTFGSQYSFYNAQAQADQAGTLYIEASYDAGTTYIPIASVATVAVTNAAGTTYYVAQARAPLTGPFSSAALYRVVYKNGATAQAAFRITSSFTAG